MESKKNPIVLNDKVDEFIRRYKAYIKGRYTSSGERRKPIQMADFIEKMAVWYELRYPNCEVSRLIDGSINGDIDDIMFNRNNYINEQFDEETEVRVMDWDEFYNTKVFVSSLSPEERFLLRRPRYPKGISFYLNGQLYRFALTSRGSVRDLCGYSEICIADKANVVHVYDGVNIEELLSILIQTFDLGKLYVKKLKSLIDDYKSACSVREEMLNCVMYRIIERGGNRIGPRRGLLFAEEFSRDVDIPMMYGIDSSDPHLREFVMRYFEDGGSKDLECYVDYFTRERKYEPLRTVTTLELLMSTGYTTQEVELHQRLVDILGKRVQEEGKRLKFEPVHRK